MSRPNSNKMLKSGWILNTMKLTKFLYNLKKIIIIDTETDELIIIFTLSEHILFD